MSYRFHGRARINPSAPRAVGQCDRCGFVYNLEDLKPQMRWAGTAQIDTGLHVCPTCMLIPNPQTRTIVPPPDPVPLKDTRPLTQMLRLAIDEVDEMTTEDGEDITTEDGDDIITDDPNPTE